MARLNVADIRENGLGDVIHYPVREDESHSFIIRTESTNVGKDKRARELVKLAKWL